MARQEDEAIDRLLTRTLRSRTASSDVCPDAEDVAAYLERTLDAEEARRVELHLSTCARCAETLAMLVETEPVASSAPPAAGWRSWSAWRWAVPAAAVLVIGVWFASSLRDGGQPASQMARSNQAEEAPKQESATQSAEPPAMQAKPGAASATQATPAESAPAGEAAQSSTREAEKAVDRIQPRAREERAPSEADSAARPSNAVQPLPDQPRALAKAEESRADAAPADTRSEGANAGFAAPTAAAGAPATAAAPPTAEPPAGGAARAAGAAAPRATARQQTAETVPDGARAVAGFAPLILRTRSGNALWRFAGSVIERSTDGGTTWAMEFRASGTITTGVVATDDTVWLVGAGGLVLRRPAAGPWRVVPPPGMENLVGVSEPGAASVTVRAVDGRQFRTTDNGSTWMVR